jgi:hypothetical protein
MPEPIEKPEGQAEPSKGNPSVGPPDNGKPDTNGNAKQSDPDAFDPSELIRRLKQGLTQPRLPPELRDEILADSPPPEELERLYRELQESGGLSSEQFLESLGVLGEPQP